LKAAKVVAYWLFMFCFPLLLLTSTVRLGINSIHTYEYSFDNYNVSQLTGINATQLSAVAGRLIDYFNSRVETPQVTLIKNGESFQLFQENDQNCELTHLKDVKSLFQLDYLVQVISLAYIITYALLFLLRRKGHWQDVAKGVTRGCALTLVLMAMLGVASVFINFEQSFIQFHHFVFHNQCWMSTGYLPMLFPEQFWQDVAFFGGVAIAVEALLLGGISRAILFIYNRRQHLDKP
jgi:integral membrane protein (TIGR01906 family)